jgi:hypothetical protein
VNSKKSPHKHKSSSNKRQSGYSKTKQAEYDTQTRDIHNLINDVKSLSPRYIEYQPSQKASRPSSKMASGSQRKNYENPAMATMMYKDFVMSPSTKNNKILKKKKEAHKKKDMHGNSKMMRSGSMSNMFQNNSITDSASKKKSMSRQKTSGALKTIPYSVSQKMMKSTSSTLSPTIAMFNSIINNHKNQKSRKKTSSRKKSRKGISPNSYSKFKNTFLSMYDYNSPTTASRSSVARPPPTSIALKKLLSDKKCRKSSAKYDSNMNHDRSYLNTLLTSKMQDINAVSINSCNGKPLMVKVGNESRGLVEYNNYLRQTSKTPMGNEYKPNLFRGQNDAVQNETFQQKSPFYNDLALIKNKFTSVLESYKQREMMLMERCKYLETKLMKYEGGEYAEQ